jgi:hypothetical protein
MCCWLCIGYWRREISAVPACRPAGRDRREFTPPKTTHYTTIDDKTLFVHLLVIRVFAKTCRLALLRTCITVILYFCMICFPIKPTFFYHNSTKALTFPTGDLFSWRRANAHFTCGHVAVEKVTRRWVYRSALDVRQLFNDLRVFMTNRNHLNMFLMILLVFEVY